jgi:tRNA (guanine37-N1)-methyltransferase
VEYFFIPIPSAHYPVSDFKDILRKSLTTEELSHLKTAFDAIGDIAILEIDDELRKKEKFIAKALLDSQKNIKTVLRKDSAHEGEFRLQKMKHLAGEKRKETIHKESGCRLKLDVEQVYFSPRMGHERLRVAEQVKPGENILCLFSGCGPYPIVLSKNTDANFITGVEINPEGHKYALENIGLNKAENVAFLLGDAREVVKRMFNKRIGLKSYWDKKQMASRLKAKPKIMEIHMYHGDLDKHLEDVEQCIRDLKKKKIEILLHVPMLDKGIELDLTSPDPKIRKESIKVCQILEKLCVKYNLSGFIMHPYMDDGKEHDKKLLMRQLKYKHLKLENLPYGFFIDPTTITEFSKRANICIDLVHLFLTRHQVYKDVAEIAHLHPYYHIADTKSWKFDPVIYHADEVGTGNIDISRLIPYIDYGVIEVRSENELTGAEMMRSYRKFNKMVKDYLSFDRILMPLPKGGENFLDVAISAGRKGTIIHFYDFLHENDFDLARKKVDAACRKAKKKWKELAFAKCGQHAPRTYRICLDFQLK